MTRRRVREQSIVAVIGYATGFGLLLAWPTRQTVNQDNVLLVGIAILVVVCVIVDWLVFKRRPQLEFRPSQWRPGRYSIPNILGLFGAGIYAQWLRGTGGPDRGLIAYAVVALVIFAGATVSDLWWARSTESPRDIPAR